MTPAQKVKLGLAAICTFIVLSLLGGLFGKNSDTQFTVKQPIHPWFGDMSVIDRGGYYLKGLATTWQWDKFDEYYFSAATEEGGAKDESVRITFNGGGQAKVSCNIKITPPTDEDERIKYNRQFTGNSDNVKSSIRSHLINCLKNTAPLMTASEHQSARKSEFAQLIEQQMRIGEYAMKQNAHTIKDSTDQNGNAITVLKTEIVRDEETNQPVIAKASPLVEYGMTIIQFSITGTEYDPKTQELFASKKESLLKAERAKAQREEEVQNRLMVEERGMREKAEMEAKANVERAEAVIKAEKEREMAEIAAKQKVLVEEQAKLEAVARLAKELAIETQEKIIAETKAAKEAQMAVITAQASLDVAKLRAEAAIEEAKAIDVLASAEENRIQKAGAITEKERILAEIAKDEAIGVAAHLKDINVPNNMNIISGVGGGTGGNADVLTSHLVNLKIMTGLGILDDEKAIAVAKKIAPKGK